MAARRPAPRKWEIKRPTLYGQMGPAQFDAPDPAIQTRERELAAPAGQPVAPAPAPAGSPRPAPRGRNGWRVLDGVLGGRTISESMDYEDSRIEAAQQRAAAQAQAQGRVEAFQQAVDDRGNFDPRAYLMAHDRLGIPLDPADVKSIMETGRPVFADDVTVGGIRFRPGQDGSYTEVARDSRPDWQKGPDRNNDGEEDWFNANPSPQGAPRSNPPPVLTELPPTAVVRPPRPTEAPATVGAAPQGFKDRNEVVGFVQQRYSGRPTSGYRSQAEQDALVRRGVTRATRSSHTYANGQDFVPDVPQSEWPRIKAELEATGRFRRVIIETGRGRNQGTGAHIHLEPY